VTAINSSRVMPTWRSSLLKSDFASDTFGFTAAALATRALPVAVRPGADDDDPPAAAPRALPARLMVELIPFAAVCPALAAAGAVAPIMMALSSCANAAPHATSVIDRVLEIILSTIRLLPNGRAVHRSFTRTVPWFMHALSSAPSGGRPVIAAYDWSQFAVIADIAGGIGTQLIDILDGNPNCSGVIFDQPDVVGAAIEHERVKLVPGNFFEKIPIDADAYILRNIVHDWNDEDALAILRTLRRATRPTARVMLIEWLIPESSDFNFGKWTDITMMTSVGGRERTKTEFETLFSEAGFELEEIVPTASSFSIVVGRPSV
jgi:hypothetical protein